MSAPAVETPVAVPAKSPAKPKKKPAAPKKPADHPTYNVMATEAIKALKERTGSSRQAILGYIMKNYTVTDQAKVNSRVKLALKNGVAKKEFKQVKGTGASGSFRIGDAVTAKPKAAAKPAKKVSKPKSATPKKVTKPTTKKTPTKKSVVAKKSPAKKSVVAKKSPAKKTAAKPAAKKSVAKKPAAKKTKKPAAKK